MFKTVPESDEGWQWNVLIQEQEQIMDVRVTERSRVRYLIR
jgi:hypothetical protein